jgi:diguanylate cyclase (GGDEF)-like protein
MEPQIDTFPLPKQEGIPTEHIEQVWSNTKKVVGDIFPNSTDNAAHKIAALLEKGEDPEFRKILATKFIRQFAHTGKAGVIWDKNAQRVLSQSPSNLEDVDLEKGHETTLFALQQAIQDAITEYDNKTESITDELTGLLNRRGFFNEFHRFIGGLLRTTLMNHMTTGQNNAVQRDASITDAIVIFEMDADHFKQINDNYSHLVGDQALNHIGKVLGTMTRPSDVIGRVGGEEFLGILPHHTTDKEPFDPNMLYAKINEKRNAISSYPYTAKDGVPLSVTMSAGAIVYTRNELLKRFENKYGEGKANLTEDYIHEFCQTLYAEVDKELNIAKNYRHGRRNVLSTPKGIYKSPGSL